MEKEFVAKGINGAIVFLGNKIIIERKGVLSLLTQGLKGNKEILVKQISAIRLKKSGLTSGYIQFSFLGGQETHGGVFDATRDENTVMFIKKQEPNFEKIKELIEMARDEQHQLKGSSSNADELKKLFDLFKAGAITKKEFESKKKELL